MHRLANTSGWPQETLGLRRLLFVLIPVSAAFALAGGSGWLLDGSAASGAIALIMGTALSIGAVAWYFAARGRVIATVTTITVTMLTVAILEAVVPPGTPGLAALPLVAAAIALQYVGGATLRRLLVLCWAASLLVAVIVEIVPSTAMPGLGDPIRRVSTVAGIIAITMILLEQFAARLRESLAAAEGARAALAASEVRLRTLVEELDEVVFSTDREGRWTLLNPAWTRVSGRTVEESLGHPFWEFIGEEEAPAIRERIEALVAGRIEVLGEQTRLIDSASRVRWVEVRARAAFGEGGRSPGVSGTLTDITERHRLEDELTELAFHDALTGLANRALFQDRVKHTIALRRRTPHAGAVIFLDLDGFKVVNDSLGHAAGDRLLIETAARLDAQVRAGDTIARLGGDEFGILLEDVADADEAIQIASRLANAVREPVSIEGRELVATASAGVAMLDGQPVTVEDVLRNADVAMYQAKALKDGRVALFQPAMHEAAVARLEDLGELRAALERDEFYLDYQPIVDLETSAMTGVEALVRWRHPVRGTVPPDMFIPLAEESGLIIPLGLWVAREACQQLVAWQVLTPGRGQLAMHVNISAVQLAHPDLVAQMAAIFDETGVEAGRLVFEITESAVMVDPDGAEERIRHLKSLGVRVAIDDFGTGYSSLSYIRRFPIDVLKLDRSLISGLENDSSSAAMAELFVRLGRLLQVETLAEGIETAGEAEILRGLNCRSAQGFHYSRPVGPIAIASLLSGATTWPATVRAEGEQARKAG